MKRWPWCVRAGLLSLAVALSPSGQAQGPAPDGVDCRLLAQMPNAPMSVQTCERRMAAHADMTSALETPGGERAGDERMTCEAIVAELKTMRVGGVSRANAAAGEAAGRDVMALMQRAMAESMAMMGAQTARSAAAAAVPGNAAGHGAATANLAEQQALQERTARQMGPARERLDAANLASMAELTQAMRAHPRLARLVKLAGERQCTG